MHTVPFEQYKALLRFTPLHGTKDTGQVAHPPTYTDIHTNDYAIKKPPSPKLAAAMMRDRAISSVLYSGSSICKQHSKQHSKPTVHITNHHDNTIRGRTHGT